MDFRLSGRSVWPIAADPVLPPPRLPLLLAGGPVEYVSSVLTYRSGPVYGRFDEIGCFPESDSVLAAAEEAKLEEFL